MKSIELTVQQALAEAKNKAPYVFDLVEDIAKTWQVVLFGGAVRDWVFNDGFVWPHNFDFVVNCSHANLDRNFDNLDCSFLHIKESHFGGIKVDFGKISFDIWSVFGAFGFDYLGIPHTLEDLTKTVFLNSDGIQI